MTPNNLAAKLAALASVLALTLAACGDSPTDPGPLTLHVVGESDPSAPVGASLEVVVKAQRMDSPRSGVTIEFDLSTDAGTVSSSSVITDANGRAEVTWTLGEKAGDQTLIARAAGVELRIEANALPEAPAEIVWPSEDPVIDRLGEAERHAPVIRDQFGNSLAASPELEIVSQAAWASDIGTLDDEARAEGRIVAVGPGDVTLIAKHGELESEVQHLTIELQDPTVLGLFGASRVEADDTVRVAGFEMGEVVLTLRGQPVRVLRADSAIIEFMPPTPQADCEGAGYEEIGVEGAAVASGINLSLRRSRENEIVLAAGKAIRLPSARNGCIVLHPDKGATYVVAAVDSRPLIRAETEIEPRSRWSDWGGGDNVYSEFTVGFADQAALASGPEESEAVAGAAMLSVERDDAALPDTIHTPHRDFATPTAIMLEVDEDLDHMSERYSPWQEGDRGIFPFVQFTNCDFSNSDHRQCGPPVETFEGPGTVARVYDERIVLVVPDRFRVPPGLDFDILIDSTAWLDGPHGADSRLPLAVRSEQILAEDFFPGLAPDEWPTTGATGQLVIVSPFMGYGLFVSYDEASDDTWIHLPIGLAWEHWPSERFVLHELAHAWQFAYMAHSSRPNSAWSFTDWAIEGGANLAAEELIRIDRGDAFTANALTPGLYPIIGSFGWFTTVPAARSFQEGYERSSWFLRFLAHQLVDQGGLSEREAIGLVTRNSLNGWYGLNAGDASMGLVHNVREILGPSWEPVDALLETILAQAADDRNPNPFFQIPSVRDASQSSIYRGWSRTHGEDKTTVAAGSGQRHELNSHQGLLVYFEIDSDVHGGSYEYFSSIDGIEWMMLRIE